MAYTLTSDVRRAMRKLPASYTDEEIQFHIDKAVAYINGMLSGVYTVPFAETPELTPPLIRHLTIDLTVFFIAEELYSSQKPNMDEYEEKRYKRVNDMINQLIAGSLILTGVPRLDTNSPAGFATTNEIDGIFSLDEPYW